MIKAIAQSQLGIIVKNISLAAVLVLGLSQTAKADEANKHQDLRISCDPAINQDSRLNCSFNNLPPEVEQNADIVAQGGRGRRRKSKVQGYYGGFALGAMFPTGGLEPIPETITPDTQALLDAFDIDPTIDSTIDYSTGFAGSVFGGIKFTEKLGAELEFMIGTGGGDSDNFNEEFEQLLTDAFEAGFNGAAEADGQDVRLNASAEYELDVDYTVFALYASPRFDLPVSNKLTVFVSPGIGLSQTNVSTTNNIEIGAELVDDDLPQEELDAANDLLTGELEQAQGDEEAQEVDLSKTGITFRIKAGAEYQISDTIGIFGQASYVTLPTEDSDVFEVDNLNSFLAQAGLNFSF